MKDDTPPALPEDVIERMRAAHAPMEALATELLALHDGLISRGQVSAARVLAVAEEDARTLKDIGAQLGQLRKDLQGSARRQWRLLVHEWSQSREAVSLLRKRISGELDAFSPEEERLVKDQVADLFRMVPASVIALAPVPGIAMVTPFVLRKLGLLPSAWREAHLLERLKQAATSLRELGAVSEAERVESLAAEWRARRDDAEDRRRTLREHPGIRSLYDVDLDGRISDAEWQTIKADRDQIGRMLGAGADWYYTTSGEVEGPIPVADLCAAPLPEHTLVRSEGMDRWVPLELLLDVRTAGGPGPPPQAPQK